MLHDWWQQQEEEENKEDNSTGLSQQESDCVDVAPDRFNAESESLKGARGQTEIQKGETSDEEESEEEECSSNDDQEGIQSDKDNNSQRGGQQEDDALSECQDDDDHGDQSLPVSPTALHASYTAESAPKSIVATISRCSHWTTCQCYGARLHADCVLYLKLHSLQPLSLVLSSHT